MPIVLPRSEAGRKTKEPRPAARVVLSHPGNAPFVQHAARALEEAGLLSAYVTTFVYQRDSALGRSLRGALSLLMRDADRQRQGEEQGCESGQRAGHDHAGRAVLSERVYDPANLSPSFPEASLRTA